MDIAENKEYIIQLIDLYGGIDVYLLEEVFALIAIRLKMSNQDAKRAFEIQKKILEYLPSQSRGEYRFRYNLRSKNVALNITNYRIYLYPYNNSRELYEFLYVNDKIADLEQLGIRPNITFEFKDFQCKLLELSVEELERFTNKEWKVFNEAVGMSLRAKKGRLRESNIYIDWDKVDKERPKNNDI